MWFRMLRRVILIILARVMIKNKVKIKDMHLAGMTRDNSSFRNQEKINENCVQAQGNFQQDATERTHRRRGCGTD